MFTFVELQSFAAVRDQYLSEDDFARLQLFLVENPDAGNVIPRSGGCRKLRWLTEGRGKRVALG